MGSLARSLLSSINRAWTEAHYGACIELDENSGRELNLAGKTLKTVKYKRDGA